MTKKQWKIKVVTKEAPKIQGKASYRSGFQHPKDTGKSEVRSFHKKRKL